uniref:Rap-GAP domain-containing protein n=1 Tax=Panagrolaimus superbus TaxID=310955 RepID=A0A914YG23_9BILA
MSASERSAQAQQAMDMLAFIRRSNRRPLKNISMKNSNKENNFSTNDGSTMQAWRKFAADFSFIKTTQTATTNFPRELRHLDNTSSREVHKVAVIYVAEGQDDKQSILSNSNGSLHFNYFVEGLGWPVQIGTSSHLGYSGGLSVGQTTPYYSTVDTEVIFHVSTQLSGDAQMKMKHLGNDEVHVVWSENPRQSYRRELLATRFCDVLIVLYPVSPVLIRVHIETQNQLLLCGPLLDGAIIHTKQVASLVRDTVINASRAYRLAQKDCDRPNKLREKVFEQTKSTLKEMSVADAITQIYVPKFAFLN